jgi:hypothetical protein
MGRFWAGGEFEEGNTGWKEGNEQGKLNFGLYPGLDRVCHLGERRSDLLATEVAAFTVSRRRSSREASSMVDMNGIHSGLGFCYVRKLDMV